jgi:superfamily II DNA or RNA helicase
MSKDLRPFQSQCHESIIEAYNRNVIRQLIILFTGAGKTYLLIKLIERMGFKRVLWLSFQEELVTQSAMAFIADKFNEEFFELVEEVGFLDYLRNDYAFPDGFTIGCVKADVFKPDANVVMGSIMTVAKRLDKLPEDYYDLIICDEAHLFGSKTAYSVIEYFKPKLLIGATATAHREDGMMMGDIFEEIVFEYGLDKGIKDGWCTELDAIRVKTNVNLDEVKTVAGDLNLQDLSSKVDTLARNQLIVNKWKEYALGRQTIAFCVNINHAINLAETFQNSGINAVAVSSNEELTPDRSEKIKAFKDGRIDVITNVGVLVAGFDHVPTGCAIMACPTKSLTKYLQSVGRAARLKKQDYIDKFGQNAILIDVVDITNRHNLINSFELDKKKPLEDRCFTTQEKKDLILLDRLAKSSAKIDHERGEDEMVTLLQLPERLIVRSIRMKEMANEQQLRTIKMLGYDTDSVNYSKQMCIDIMMSLPCNSDELAYLSSKGYEVKGASKAHYQRVYNNHEIKGNQWRRK